MEPRENEKKPVLLPKFSQNSLEILPLAIKEIFVFPNNNFCLLYESEQYQFWSFYSKEPLLISQKTLPFSYLALTKKGVSSLCFLTKGFKLITIDLRTGEQDYEFSYDFLLNCEKDQTQYLQKISEKGTFNQFISLFQMSYLEKVGALCVLIKDTLKENLMNYTLYIWQAKKPVVITHDNEKSFFISLFNIDNKMLVLFDLLHDLDKNPTMIIWETPGNRDDNILQERHLKLSRRLTGAVVSFSLHSSKVLAAFVNLNGVENPNVFLINIDDGETIAKKFELINNENSDEFNKNWLFDKVLLNSPEKNLFVFQQFEFNGGFNIIIRNNSLVYGFNDYAENLWDSSFDGECLVGCRENEKKNKRTCVKLINFIEKKLAVLFLLEEKKVLSKYGSLVAREIFEFL